MGKNKKIAATVATGTLLGAMAVVPGMVSANSGFRATVGPGRQGIHIEHADNLLQPLADMLGISVDELKTQLDDKTFEEVVTQYGYENIEDFKTAAEQKLREKLAGEGYSDEEIEYKISERREHVEKRHDHREQRLKKLAENFDPDVLRKRLEEKGIGEENISHRIEHIQKQIDRFEHDQ